MKTLRVTDIYTTPEGAVVLKDKSGRLVYVRRVNEARSVARVLPGDKLPDDTHPLGVHEIGEKGITF